MSLPVGYLWKNVKKQIIRNIELAEITDTEAASLIVEYQRCVNSCLNQIYRGTAWITMCESTAKRKGEAALSKLYEDHAESFKKYCAAAGLFYGHYFGDALA